MRAQIESSKQILAQFLARQEGGLTPFVDRPEIVAHATLAALAHHWPSLANPEDAQLLERTSEIKVSERSRWMTQRRIAIAKLCRYLDSR